MIWWFFAAWARAAGRPALLPWVLWAPAQVTVTKTQDMSAVSGKQCKGRSAWLRYIIQAKKKLAEQQEKEMKDDETGTTDDEENEETWVPRKIVGHGTVGGSLVFLFFRKQQCMLCTVQTGRTAAAADWNAVDRLARIDG
jgi:hypothetical protein